MPKRPPRRLPPLPLAAVVTFAGLATVDSAQAQTNIFTSPYLGKTCSKEGADCVNNSSSRPIDFTFSVTSNIVGSNLTNVSVLQDSSLDPDDFRNWTLHLPQVRFSTASSNISDPNHTLRKVVNGRDSWKNGGLVRVGVYRRDEGTGSNGFYEYLDARFRDFNGTLTRYPVYWKVPGVPLDPALGATGVSQLSIVVLGDDSVTPADEAKHGNFLTALGSVANPAADTDAYYNNTCVTIPSGSTVPVTSCSASSNSIRAVLGTLSSFRTRYGMATSDTAAPATGEYVAKYFNRGDLGIGRDMHCKHRADTNETACYVKNFSSDATKVFGGSAATAFSNMDSNTAFATVAMVSRGGLGAGAPNKVIFLVYGSSGNLQNVAALDRHANANLGNAGTNYNKHIPGNCMNCHGAGGSYTPQTASASTRGAVGGMFLPFDLDQFSYHPTNTSLSRSNQQAAFKNLNIQIVKKVADQYGAPRAGAIINTINGWYNNGSSATFVSSYVPAGWKEETNFGDKHFYQKVLRPFCRGCHMTYASDDYRSFESYTDYASASGTAALYMCPPPGSVPFMPQAEQASREMWRSDARGIFVAYAGSDNMTIKECIPGNNR